MLIKGVTDEDFVNYKLPSMFICTNTCSFKCERESGTDCCQNDGLKNQSSVDIDVHKLIERYLRNDITKAIVFGGLEPFDQMIDIYDFIFELRNTYHCSDTVVIYTGYNKDEVQGKLVSLNGLENIIVKFGRFIPGQECHFDTILGVKLASDNQYAEKIS